ncbi:MAG: metallophosphoesterase [Methanomassiliicoccaceae archaeon]|jgi:putative SbcD/Mre11-related phosphoesterase|nr:metallophosphoesterase [Methanomassiliicoccaceae archaeon]
MNIQPVHGHPALRVDDVIVIADLHIGVESHLGSKGFHLPSRTSIMRDDILSIAGDATRLVVLGDVKDSVPGSTKQEYREIPDFFQAMIERFNVVDVVIGNHDTQIEDFLPRHVNIHPASGLRIGDVGMVHGHTWPSADVMASKTLITAHNHPTVMFRDGVGKRTTEPCWFRVPFNDSASNYIERPGEMIIVPAFNRLLGGSPVNVVGEGFLGPLMNSGMISTDEAQIFLLDGICLGKRKDVLVKGKDRSVCKE